MTGLILILLGILHRLSGVNCADLILNPDKANQIVKEFVHSSLYINCYHVNATGITWHKNNNDKITTQKDAKVHIEPGIDSKGLSLIFSDMVASDTGTYTCKAKVNNKDKQTSFKLVVYTPVTFADTSSVQTANEGEPFTIRCEAKGDPDPKISWLSPDVDIADTKHFEQLADGLSITRVTRGYGNATFICRAKQFNADVSDVKDQRITLNVLYKPDWKYPNKTMDVYGYIGGTTNVTCLVDANPPANFTWFNQNRKIIYPNNNNNVKIFYEHNKSVLRISNFNKGVLGEYICKAKNSIGETERKFRLHEGPKPEPPKKAKLHSATHNSLKLEIHSPEGRQNKLEIIGFKVQILEKKEKEKGKGWEVAREVELPKGETNIYIIPNLSPNTEYLIRVHSLNAAGPSDPKSSKELEAHTSDSSKLYISNLLILLLVIASRFT